MNKPYFNILYDKLIDIEKQLATQVEQLKQYGDKTKELENIIIDIERRANIAEGAIRVIGTLSAFVGIVMAIAAFFK